MNKQTKAILSVLLFIALLLGLKFIYDSQTQKDYLGKLSDNTTTSGGTTPQNSTAEAGASASSGTSAAAGTTLSQGTTSARRTVPLPDITVYDGTGKAVKLSSFRGKKLVINAWASWCGPCKAEMPDFEKLDQEADGTYRVVMVNITGGLETRENSDRFLKDNNLEFTNMLYDNDRELASKLEISVIPTSILVDEDGNIHYYQQGTLTREQVRNALASME